MIDGSAQGSMAGLITTASLKGRQMAAVRTQHTAPEIAVRKAMHARGLRFRLHRRDLPGRPDIVLVKHQTAVFVHGCFWHGCALCDRGTRRPKSNAGFWSAKLDENRRRDDRNTAALTQLGWHVSVIWECETRSPDRLAETLDRILTFVPSMQPNGG
jgi:DNA mismatch endonuclease (patch repair protein)